MNFGNQMRAQKTAIISTLQELMESLPEWHEISLSEVCIHSLEGAHALVSHPSLPPASAPTGWSLPLLCVFTSLKEVMWRYLLSFKKAKTSLHQLNSLAHTDLKLTAISSSRSPFDRIALRRPSFWDYWYLRWAQYKEKGSFTNI